MDKVEPKLALEAPPPENAENDNEHVKKNHGKKEFLTEMKKLMCLAGPLSVVSFLQYSLSMISLMFVGHLGELPLSGCSMATSFAGVTGYSLMMGMGSAMETFCGQAYGAKQHHMLGVHMQRAMLVLTLVCIPIALLWSCAELVFIRLKQDPEIAAQAGLYARWLIPSIIPYGLLQCQLRFLQTQSITKPLMICTGITSLFHVIVCWILVVRLEFGVKGAALAIAISYWTNVMFFSIFIKCSPSCRNTWTGFSKEGLRNLVEFLKLAIPSSLMVSLECWAYEFLVLSSGFLPNPKLETSMMAISLNTNLNVYRISYGFASAVSTRVSNELGAGKPRAARLAAGIVIFLVVTQGLIFSLVAVLVRNKWGYLYTEEREVVRYLAAAMPWLALCNFMDGLHGVFAGVVKGCGRQKIGAYVTMGSYYLVGIPIAIILAFFLHFGGKGLWMGILCGSSLHALLLLIITLTTNWDDQVNKAKERVHRSSINRENMRLRSQSTINL